MNAMTRNSLGFMILLLLAGAYTSPATAQKNDWYAELELGQSLNGEDTLGVDATNLPAGNPEVDFETGYTFGIAIGKRLGDSWRLEGEYRYRTDELGFAEFPGGTRFEDGDYSSVVLSANAYYDFPDLLKNSEQELRAYLGAGYGWIQEVDIDFERAGQEISYETDDFGYQLMAGFRWRFAPRWTMDFEYRQFSADDVVMTSPTGSVTSDYAPVSLGFGLGWSF